MRVTKKMAGTPAQAVAQAPEEDSARLKKLVAELVEKNQALRFEVAALKKAKSGVDDATRFVLLW